MKISHRVFELLGRHKIMKDRQTDGQMDGQGDYYRAPPTSSSGALNTLTQIVLIDVLNSIQFSM